MSPSPDSEYSSSGFFVLRTPLLPVEDFLKLSRPAAEGVPSPPAADRAFARSHLLEWLTRPEAKEALWLASPDFAQLLNLWRADPESAKARRLQQTLYRYLARMTARATPFGAFAGCSVGEIARDTRLELAPRGQYRRATRLDMEYLFNLAESLSADPTRRGRLRFRCNSSLHLAAGKYHHMRGELRDGNRVFQLVATDPTPALDATFLRAASGATADALASAIVDSDGEVTRQDADAFIARLIASELLVPELAPPVTGADAVGYMAGQLEQAGASHLAEDLRSVGAELRRLDQGGLGSDLGAYDSIAAAVSRLPGEFRPGRLIQMDLIKPAVASLDQRLVNDILRAVETLHCIRTDSSQAALAPFLEQFQERYQEREVPLLEALDDEAGIGFENEDNPTSEPLIAEIDFRPLQTAPAEENAEGPGNANPEAGAALLAGRLQALRQTHGMVLELDAELVEALKVADPLPLPDALSCMGVCFRAPDGDPGFYIQSISGPSGANLLARFCHADESLARRVEDHLRAEEALHRGDAVFAEIAHLPEGRVGNVVCRPALRRYEIPYLATPGLPPERQIPLADLTVSVRESRIILRSRRLGHEVLPRLTSAHNFSSPRCLKLYKFLGLLQHQGACAEVCWHWGGQDDAMAAFLPRVAMGNIVFSLARWRVSRETASDLFPAGRAAQERDLEAWRTTNRVPRFAFIAEADNQLLIDFENALGVETFFEHIRKNAETLLIEMFPAPRDLVVHGPEGSFVHEMILPFVRTKPREALRRVKPAVAARARVAAGDTVPAGFSLAPGSEWLFAKLYCSPSHADRLLLELVRPLTAETGGNTSVAKTGATAQEAGIAHLETARRWFFLRYGDPHWHLRLRFHGAPDYLRAQVLPALLERARPFQRQGVLWRLEFDIYEPELERYGGPMGIGVAERVFHFSSELCLDLLPLVLLPLAMGDSGAELRWQLALSGAVRLLSALGFTMSEKKMLAGQLRDTREQLWVADEAYRKQLARKFRDADLRARLAAIVNENNVADDAAVFPAEATAALARFSRRLQPLREQLRVLERAGQLTATFQELAASYVHMHLNRMLRSCHLEQEAVLCDFLARACAARLARDSADRDL